MRNFLNIFENLEKESYSSEIDSPEAELLSSNIDIISDFDTYAEEHNQLSHQYIITDNATIDAVKAYTDASTVNSLLLRSKNLGKHKSEYKLLKSLDGKVALGEEHHVYCGTGIVDPQEKITKSKAFLSTSLSIQVAVKNTNFKRDGDSDHVMHIILPEGFTNGFYIASYSVNPEELEFLIMPDVEFDFVDEKKIDIDGVTRTFHTFVPKNS